ncbi:hypothetical protein HC251_11210 [Iamia sp. SCSIO 61187]|uniref:hypothetical protein n=1 Tax=Iamia sp. SCSIO 61187 TaxID=2722752 RepID=UPI001C637796|nr:hypothetical protein [Iamia sp. SCSIO 61187]QYG92942.1 hypothetical protein HC251_11210 [Iamia sp. SCSIO 61187]
MTKRPVGDEGGGSAPRRDPRADERCRWCGRRLPDRARTGRPRRYCRPGCRQQAHMARKLAAVHGLGDDDVIVARQAVEELQGALYCLQAAIEDADADLADAGDDPAELRRAIAWLLDNARPAAALWIEPRTGGVT